MPDDDSFGFFAYAPGPDDEDDFNVPVVPGHIDLWVDNGGADLPLWWSGSGEVHPRQLPVSQSLLADLMAYQEWHEELDPDDDTPPDELQRLWDAGRDLLARLREAAALPAVEGHESLAGRGMGRWSRATRSGLRGGDRWLAGRTTHRGGPDVVAQQPGGRGGAGPRPSR